MAENIRYLENFFACFAFVFWNTSWIICAGSLTDGPMTVGHNPSSKSWRIAPSVKHRAWKVLSASITARLHPITPASASDNLTNDWLCLGDPAAQSARGRVDEIAGQIMLLADASLITAFLSISNYSGCLAERGGRWTSYWKSLYWQYGHQAVMASLSERPFAAACSSAWISF